MALSDKLKIKENTGIYAINAPGEFEKTLGKLPEGSSVVKSAKDARQIHWFVIHKTQLETELEKTLKLLKEGIVIWIYYPKTTSGIQTDLTRDKGWDKLLAYEEIQWLSLISFDDTWSAFACRMKTEADLKKESKPRERPIFDYIDPVKKIVRVPDDLAKAFRKEKKLEAYFNSLAYSHRKEYVEWIVSAKREETRVRRIQGTLEKLEKGL